MTPKLTASHSTSNCSAKRCVTLQISTTKMPKTVAHLAVLNQRKLQPLANLRNAVLQYANMLRV